MIKSARLFLFFVIFFFAVSPVFSDDPIPNEWCQQNPDVCEVKDPKCPPYCNQPPPCVGGPQLCDFVDGGGGGGDGAVGSIFYCSQPGSPTGLNVRHQCLSYFTSEYSMPNYNYCLYGGAYPLTNSCSVYRDPCRIENFGSTGGVCRGESWRETGECQVVGDGCSDPPSPCSRCVRVNTTGGGRDDEGDRSYCRLEVNDCCTQTSETGCSSIGSCWWNCPAGSLIPPTPNNTPTPTPILKPNCKDLSAPATALVGETIQITATYEKASAPNITEAGITILSDNSNCSSVVSNNPANQSVSSSPQEKTFNWTPQSVGIYTVYCSAINGTSALRIHACGVKT